jgi:Uma2 family endonuclease
MAVAAIEPHRWTREEYEQMAGAGLFAPEARVELVEGIVYDRLSQTPAHVTSVHLAAEALRLAFPGRYVRIQFPLALGSHSEPEPDVAVVPGGPRDYPDSHPATALLIVEVADSSLLHDRKRKLPVYAAAGIAEVWILDLKRRALEVYRDPGKDAYRSKTILRAGDSVSPLAGSGVSIAVADLLP